jgi:hypothetical protein
MFIIQATGPVLPPGGRNWQLIYPNDLFMFFHGSICLHMKDMNAKVNVYFWKGET